MCWEKGGRWVRAHCGKRSANQNSNRPKTARAAIAALAMATGAVLLPRTASATAYTWVEGGEFWSNTFNWTPTGVPGEEINDSASISSTTGAPETAVYDESVPQNLSEVDVN